MTEDELDAIRTRAEDYTGCSPEATIADDVRTLAWEVRCLRAALAEALDLVDEVKGGGNLYLTSVNKDVARLRALVKT